MTAVDEVAVASTIVATDPDLLRTAVNADGAVYWNIATGDRFSLGAAAATLLELLRMPQALDSVEAATGAGAFLSRFREQGLVVDAQTLSRRRSTGMRPVPPGTGLFGCPGADVTDALADSSIDAVIVGMPYDVGATGKPGSRFAPQALRVASRTIFRQSTPGDTSGMYDPVRGRQVLLGVGMADIGDINAADVHDRNGGTMDVLEQIVGAIATAGKLPVLIGGDHSITLPAVRGVLGAHERLGILHFDAHPDYRRARDDDWRAACHHGNFMGWLLADPRVERLVQFGVRQLIPQAIEHDEKVVVWPGVSATEASVADVLRDLPNDLPYYVTIDVDCLDPLVMPSTGTPLPGGFTHLQLVKLLDELCSGPRRIVGVDLVEYLPDGNNFAGHVAADVLLRVMDGGLSSQ